MPSPGTIRHFNVPGGPGVRVDTFAHEGCEVSPYYDSLIAKLMTHGRDRAEAIARMRRGLDVMVVEGIKTNIPLHLQDHGRPRLPGRPARHPLHGALPAPQEGGPRGLLIGRRCPPPPFRLSRSSTPRALARARRGRAGGARWPRAGARLLQVRAKGLADRALVALAREVVAAAHARAARSSS